jgi:hypothetical protein
MRLLVATVAMAAALMSRSADGSGSLSGGGVSVLDCGAKADGRTDDSAAFLAALAASLDVFVPNGSYVVRRTLVLRDAQTLRGEGEWLSELLFDPLPELPPTAGLIAFPGNATNPADTNAATHGVVVTRLSLTFGDNKGLNRNRAVDMTAAQLSTVSHLKISNFQTGIFQSRGNVTAAGCWFNNVENIDFFDNQVAVDINNDVGFSVNNNNFLMLHAESTGTFASNGRSTKGYIIRGYGHHFTDIYACGMQGPESACVEFGDTAFHPEPAATHGVSPCSPGVSVSGSNLIEGLYCESAPAYGIRIKNTTQGRGGNRVESVQFDGAPLTPISDPYGELTVRSVSGAMFSHNNATQGPAMRLALNEIYSIIPSAARPACNASYSTPDCTKGFVGQSVHASFWRPEGEAGGFSAGAISSNAAGTAVHYGTTAGDRSLLVGENAPLVNALDRVRNGPPARDLRFAADPGSPTIGFFADEIHAAVPEAVRAGGAGSAAGPQVDHSKLVPLLWAAVQELSEQVAELKAELKLKA